MNFLYLKFLSLLVFPLLVSTHDECCSCSDLDKEIQWLKKQSKHNYYLLKKIINHLEDCGEAYFRDCKDALQQGHTKSGVYKVGPILDGTPVFLEVFCDMETDGGGWLVFQRRQDGSVDFYRNWYNYTNGFGDVSGEFWLGNKYLHSLTNQTNQELRVDMQKGGTSYFAKYSTFEVGPEDSKFVLSVNGSSGNAGSLRVVNISYAQTPYFLCLKGDSLGNLDGHKFSTHDQDNDIWSKSCAQTFKGAWWYSNCHSSNLNGLYLNGSHTTYANGVNWRTLGGYYYSLEFTEMKIRPK